MDRGVVPGSFCSGAVLFFLQFLGPSITSLEIYKSINQQKEL